MSHVVILGGGPGGYEAALVARKAGAHVTLIERQGLGGNAVLTDVVPSKTVIATAEWRSIAERAPELGIVADDGQPVRTRVHLAAVNARVKQLASRQSSDIRARLESEGVRVVDGEGTLSPDGAVIVGEETIKGDALLLALGARPRRLESAAPDGERILSWTDLYDLPELPEHLIVVGSGVTGAEFAGAYGLLGCKVTLIASQDRVLPREDPEASAMLTEIFKGRGMTLVGGRAAAAERVGDGVRVTLEDGTTIDGSHCLMAVGSVPNTDGLGLDEAGVTLDDRGYITVDKVSRTSAPGIYAAGDCTGVLPLASVAAAQGRIAMAHVLGDAVHPLHLGHMASTVFTAPEIATVGASEADLKARGIFYRVERLELARNPRAKMLGIDQGFVKIFGHTVTGHVLGAVIVGSRASEHIYALSLAVAHRLTVDQVAETFTVYPSLSGTTAEVARRLHGMREDDHMARGT
ncbi:NAD(P)H-quinone dehydrogenase [Demequina zhanjiangensis]|uniref:NAD(P)H-quinone dehydrogenase n=1 Tax=Demequina zhanjiangensis TaxID=3051659 RepID=A0ABT8G165_9MICO|nr:NAD(P)H-quinone dehydrogenase [Demequina sp. SYSU T00b26]MDN4472833.1 NAD(P)H-quinone dehydrogenase [Demequina sp. SYSU T00b26]